MGKTSLMIVSQTLEGALATAKSQIPPGHLVLQERVLGDGEKHSYGAIAETVDGAKQTTERCIPPNAKIIEWQVDDPVSKWVEVEAYSEEEAKGIAREPKGETRDRRWWRRKVIVKKGGKRGFLGICKRLGQYEIEWVSWAEATCKYVQDPSVELIHLDVQELICPGDMADALKMVGKYPNNEHLLTDGMFIPLMREVIHNSNAEIILRILDKLGPPVPPDLFACSQCGKPMEKDDLLTSVAKGRHIACAACGSQAVAEFLQAVRDGGGRITRV